MPIQPFVRANTGRCPAVIIGCLVTILWALLAVGCQAAGSPVEASPAIPTLNTDRPVFSLPGQSPTTTRTATAPPQTTSTPVPTAAHPTPTPVLVETPQECRADWCVYPAHFLMRRPVAGSSGGPVDHTYSYAALRDQYPKPHSGVELQAPAGEVVVAAAPGRVVIAGTDRTFRYGYVRNFYGRLVILEHDLPSFDTLVYTLYAHLEQIDVAPGDEVQAGEPIGRVGSAGRATGPHLHFEVRLGEPSLKTTRNPELWLPPDSNSTPEVGILAGSILDPHGQFCPVDTVVIQSVTESGEPAGKTVFLSPYQGTWWNEDDLYRENFATGDLPAGSYQISFVYLGQVWSRLVNVLPGKVSVVRFVVSPPD